MEQELIENYEQNINFVIGYAGTGKSTLLAKEATAKTLVVTPTHKAKEVLLDKGVKNVATIHSVLKLVPTIDQNFRKRGKLQKLARIGDVSLADINKIIIDEYSMIPTFILDMLLELLPDDADVSIYGDSYQLPPVEGDPIDPYFYTAEENIVQLTTQYRSEAPEVVESFTRFVEYLEFGGNIDLRLNSDIKHGTIEGFDPDTDRALAFTNAETININRRIAEHLGLPSEISVGEQVSINGVLGKLVQHPKDPDILTIYPQCIAKGVLMQGLKLRDKIESIEEDRRKFRSKTPESSEHFIEIQETTYRFLGDINHYVHSKGFKVEVEDSQLALISKYDLPDDTDLKLYCREHKCPLTTARGQAWSNYLGHQHLVFDLRRPFCTTVHKAQGSEFDTIYLAQQDLKKSIRGGHYETYARLMYVALSRAIHKVVVI